jgi:hypothetical protein
LFILAITSIPQQAGEVAEFPDVLQEVGIRRKRQEHGQRVSLTMTYEIAVALIAVSPEALNHRRL